MEATNARRSMHFLIYNNINYTLPINPDEISSLFSRDFWMDEIVTDVLSLTVAFSIRSEPFGRA